MITGGIPKFVRWVLIAAAALGVTTVVLSWRSPDLLTIGYSDSPLGPVGPADRDMLFKVKQAGLWEMPVGQEIEIRATTAELRAVGKKIAIEHHELDVKVTQVAAQLSIQLPDEPTPDQKNWMSDISAASSGGYDREAVFFLRQAHGKILPLLASVRAGTRNSLIRSFANEGITYVNRHMGYLESTGLVDFSQLPEPPTPSPYQQPPEASFFDSRDGRTLIVSTLVVATIAVLLTVLVHNLFRSGPPSAPRYRHTLREKEKGK